MTSAFAYNLLYDEATHTFTKENVQLMDLSLIHI